MAVQVEKQVSSQRDSLKKLATICSDVELTSVDELMDFGLKAEAVLDTLIDESLVTSRVDGWQVSI